jgi:MFS family permease
VLSRFRSLIRSPFSALYDEARLLPDIRRSMHAIIVANIFGNLCGIVTNGPALAGFAGALKANDLSFGLLSGIPFAATLLQIPFASLVSRTQKRKKYMLTLGLTSRLLWILVGLVPYFVPMDPVWLRLWSVIFLVGISSFGGAVINVSWFPWLSDLLPMRIRGRWFSLRDSINSLIGTLFGLLIAFLLDSIPGFPGYSLVFVLGGIFGTLDMASFVFVKEVYSQPPQKVKILPTFKKILQDKPFVRLTLFWTAWCFTANICGPYLNRYALDEMGLNFTQVTLSSQIASALTTFLVVSRWGRVFDRYGSKPVLWVSCIVAALTPGFFLFSVPGSFCPMLLHNVVGATFWSAANLVVTAMQLSHSPDDLRPSYIAVFSCMANLCGTFLGTLVGGVLIEGTRALVLEHGFDLFGLLADPYKVAVFVSCLTRLGIVLYFVSHMEDEKGISAIRMVKEIAAGLRPRAGGAPRA